MIVLSVALLGVVTVVLSILKLRIHPFLALVLGSTVVLILQPWTELSHDSPRSVVDKVNSATTATESSQSTPKVSKYVPFTQRLSASIAQTFEKIGLSILMASIIGICLLESGAAARIVESIVGLFGEKRTARALAVSGFLLGVPVYFDTVFYLLLPLAKAFSKDRPKSYLMAIMAIVVGATMAHSLVPPTPGPLLVASQLGVPILNMMLAGGIVGAMTACVGYFYGLWCSRTMVLECLANNSDEIKTSLSNDPASPSSKIASSNNPSPKTSDLHKPLQRISLKFALLPLLTPALLIAIGESLHLAIPHLIANNRTLEIIASLSSDAGFALCVGAFIAILQLRYQIDAQSVTNSVSKAIADGGMILLLTCAGGGFGATLKELGIANAITTMFPLAMSPYGLLWLAFVLTAIIRAAQGSATVAMITTVGVIEPLVSSVELPFNMVYVALAIGCGSKPMPWMNDSGFWQVSTMTGMSTAETLKTFTVALTIMGIVGFAITLVGSYLLPLI